MKGSALINSPLKEELIIEVGKAFTKMLWCHGKKYNPEMIEHTLKEFINQYKYESIETILLFLDKASKREFGKFYGEWNLTTIYEWFSDFLQFTVVPIRETERTKEKESWRPRKSGEPNLQDEQFNKFKQDYIIRSSKKQ